MSPQSAAPAFYFDTSKRIATPGAIFEDLAAEPLMSRAEQELRASGETARKRDPSTLTLLTPMELQVAQLVARGMSNKEAVDG
jgi:DNA-binding NarL/FixJ family response regulator